MGCHAEHADGSRLFIEGTEGGLVTYSMFDMSRRPVVEYRDRMAEADFRVRFAPDGGPKGYAWTWHDKTPFPWDEVIKEGATAGVRLAAAADQITLARQVADSLSLRAREIQSPELQARQIAFTQLEQQHPTVAAALEAFLASLTQLPQPPKGAP
jgi:hypothetical protein